jgi:hypothetical protein
MAQEEHTIFTFTPLGQDSRFITPAYEFQPFRAMIYQKIARWYPNIQLSHGCHCSLGSCQNQKAVSVQLHSTCCYHLSVESIA